MSFNPSDEKPLSAYTDEELLSFLDQVIHKIEEIKDDE